MLGISFCVGMNSALSIITPQAAGIKDYRLCRVYLRRGQFALAVCFVPILVLLLFSDRILILLRQDPEVAKYAHTYNLAFLPAVFFFGMQDATRRFLASINRNAMATFLIIWDLCVQVGSLIVFVRVLEMDIFGIGLACSVTNFSSMIMLEMYARCCCPELKEAFNGSKDVTRS